MPEFGANPDAALVRINTINETRRSFTPDTVEKLLGVIGADKALIAEYDDALCKLLPGVQYMDPPDGGSVTPLEQVARMVADYRQQIAEQAKCIAELQGGQKKLIGWRASDYTDETSDPELAKNWAAAIGVLPIFEGDVNTKLEARTVTVKLPEPLMPAQHNSGELFMTPDDVQQGGYLNRDDVLRVLRKACAAAGITLVVGE